MRHLICTGQPNARSSERDWPFGFADSVGITLFACTFDIQNARTFQTNAIICSAARILNPCIHVACALSASLYPMCTRVHVVSLR